MLIADADPEFRMALYKRLLDRNVFSDTARDARSAIDKLIHCDYSVVVLDLQLPQLGADRILEILSNLPRAERPIILVIAPPGAAHSLDVDTVQIVLRRTRDLRPLADLVRSCIRIPVAEPAPRREVARNDDQAVA